MRYFYYKIYNTLTKVKTNDTPAFNAMLLIILLQGFNIATLDGIIHYFFNWKIIRKENYVFIGISLYLILAILNYFYLFRNRDKIVKLYQDEAKDDKIWGTILLILYIVITVTAFFGIR